MFTTNDFIPTAYSHNIESGEFLWTAPSNIALVKYGEKDNQIPANPSVFTLNNCKTITKLTLLKKKVQILFL
jgi:diphosphomevalonate decarboxylase